MRITEEFKDEIIEQVTAVIENDAETKKVSDYTVLYYPETKTIEIWDDSTDGKHPENSIPLFELFTYNIIDWWDDEAPKEDAEQKFKELLNENWDTITEGAV